MTLLLDLFAICLALVVGFLIRQYYIITSSERKTNIPFLKRYNLIFGSKDIVFTHNKVLAVNAHDRHEEMGDLFGAWFSQTMQLFCRDPDLVYKICVEDFQKHRNRCEVDSLSPYMKASLLEARDELWQASRRAVGSVLKASKLKLDNVDTDIDNTVWRMLAHVDGRLKEAKAQGVDAIIDVHQINQKLVMQSILKILYNEDGMVDFDRDYNPVVDDMDKFINVNYEYVARMCFLVPILAHVVRPLLGFTNHGKFLGQLTDKLDKIISKTLHAAKGQQAPDPSRRLTTIHSLINSYRKGDLSKNQLMGNAVFLMLAGFATSVDTTAALMWELARNQDVQDELRADLLQYGEESKYLQQCINETLRLYPGATTNRGVGQEIQYKNYRLFKGAIFNVSIYSMHRNRKYWGQDADIWKPERFEASKVEKFHPAQFIPFGIGPRNCVGYNLARLELTKFIVQFILKFKLEFCELTQPKLEFIPLGALPFALPVQGPIKLKVSPATSF